MEKTVISESEVKKIFEKLLNEEMSKVSRQDFGRVQFKIEELENSLNETIKEMRKLEDSIPSGLKGITNGRITSISSYLFNTQKILNQLKGKVKQYKKSCYSQQMDERKKK